MITIDVDKLKFEQKEVLALFKRQIDEYINLKNICEKVQWSDALYDEFVLTMNVIGKTLFTILQMLTNGTDVYVITELIPLTQKYLDMAKSFPKI